MNMYQPSRFSLISMEIHCEGTEELPSHRTSWISVRRFPAAHHEEDEREVKYSKTVMTDNRVTQEACVQRHTISPLIPEPTTVFICLDHVMDMSLSK